MPVNPVVVGLDPERDDTAPLIVAASMARITGAPLIAIAAYLHDPISNAVSGGTVDTDLRDTALARLEQLTAGTDADLIVAGGPSAARVLHEEATRLGASLVVVGSTHRGPLGRLAPGTTAERLAHGAPCPVVVAPAGVPADWAPRRIGAGFVDLHDGRIALLRAAELAEATGGTLTVRTVDRGARLDALRRRRPLQPTWRARTVEGRGAAGARPCARHAARPRARDRRGRGGQARRRARRALEGRRPARLRIARLRTGPLGAARRRDAPADPPRPLPRGHRPAGRRAPARRRPSRSRRPPRHDARAPHPGRGADQALRPWPRRRGAVAHRRARRGVRLPRAQRRGQDDHDPHAPRPAAPDGRQRRDLRSRHVARRRRGARLPRLAAGRLRLRRPRDRARSCSTSSPRCAAPATARYARALAGASTPTCTGRSGSSRAGTGRSSGSSRPSCTARRSWSWTSRPPAWTRSSRRSSPRSSASSATTARPSSSPRTTSPRSSTSARASASCARAASSRSSGSTRSPAAPCGACA